MEKPKVTKELINEVFDDIFKNTKPKQNRAFVMWANCKTQGMIKLSSKDLTLPICNEPTCPTCSSMHRALKEEASKLISKLKEEE